ncbi:sigma-70 family RNA polymerase sigma factor [Candidatus Parcubacteria bacterium]|nr:sigma-70 family RNA polymerase sigma factor [Candidatus Parcubacteria bacterium]
MAHEDQFTKDMLACLSPLKAFAISLIGDVVRAEDLVQETVMRALAHKSSFEIGTNMSAWLFTILRNYFHTQYRKRKREVEDVEGDYAGRLSIPANQDDYLELSELFEELDSIPPDQRDALILVGSLGHSYEKAAKLEDIAVGTIKSRVHRARARLEEKFGFAEKTSVVRRTKSRDYHFEIKKEVAPTSPVRHHQRDSAEFRKLSERYLQIPITPPPRKIFPISAPLVAEPKPTLEFASADLIIADTSFLFERTETLADGSQVKIYKAA